MLTVKHFFVQSSQPAETFQKMFFKEKSRVNDVGSLKLARSEINIIEGAYTK